MSNISILISKSISRFIEQFEKFKIDKRYCYSLYDIGAIKNSMNRFRQSLAWIYEVIKSYKPEKILVIGDPTIIDWCMIDLELVAPGKIHNTNFDLRYKFPIKSNSYDFIINLEVIEHIKDVEKPETRELFTFKATNNFIKECTRVLKPKAVMFLTTPNICSLNAICRLYLQKHPFLFFRHIREYTMGDLIYIFNKSGLINIRCESYDFNNEDLVYLNDNSDEYLKDITDDQWGKWRAIKEFITQMEDWDPLTRGDILFLLTQKPDSY